MPAKSRSQQRLMAMAYQVKKFKETGDGMDPLDVKPAYRSEVEDLANSMTLKQLKDFAETKHDNLPEEVKESGLTGFLSAGPFPRLNTYASQASTNYIAMNRDKRDPLIQNFMDFIEGKKKKEKAKDDLQEADAGVPGVASPNNTPGMGNVTPPSAGNVGSGDKFGGEDDEEDVNQRIGIMGYEDYKKWIKKWQKQNRQTQKAS
jgi:hypothetical protein